MWTHRRPCRRTLVFVAGALLMFLAVLAAAPLWAANAPMETRFGVLVIRSAQDTERDYAHVIKRLQSALPTHKVRLVPLRWDDLEKAVRDAQLDFVLTNGVQYIELRAQNALSGALVTQRIHEHGAEVSTRGAVILRKADRTDLANLSDLRRPQLKVALPALYAQGLLSYLGPMAELSLAGVSTQDWRWIETGRVQTLVVEAVVNGEADLGFVRTGLLEEMVQRGELVPGAVEVVNPKTRTPYPVHVSTALYPEWALAALPQVDDATSRRITAALLSMDGAWAVPSGTRVVGFTIPANYGLLEEHMRLLRMAPFDQGPTVTWQDIWNQYRWTVVWVTVALGGLLLLLLALLRVQRARAVVLDNMSDGMVRLDRQWRYRMVNRQAADMLGQPVHKLLGRSSWPLFPEGAGGAFNTLCHEAMTSGQPQRVELYVAAWDRWFENRVQPDEQGLSVFFTDITARKRQEEKLRRSEARHSAIVSALPDLLFRLDAQGTVLDVQTGHPEDLYVPPETFLNQRLPAILPPAVAQPAMEALVKTLRDEPGVALEYSLTVPSGEQRFEMRMSKIADNEVLAIARNVTERFLVQETQRLTASVFETSNDGIFITDANFRITSVNPAFSTITGQRAEEVRGQGLDALGLNTNEDIYREALRTLQLWGHWKGDIWGRRRNGEVFVERLSLTAVSDTQGHTSHHVGVFTDVSAQKAHEDELQRIASHDTLTGLANRRLLADHMKAAVSRAMRGERLLAVCYLDLDDFNFINDTHGHDAGDKVLLAVARRLQNELRGEDTLARLGGDEFVALVNGLENLAECQAMAQRLLNALLDPIDMGNHTVQVTASMGIALYPQDNVSPDTLLRHADQAMCRAKEAGRNRFHIFSAAHDRDTRSRRDLIHRLKEALDHQELQLYYQPKVNLRTGAILGYEALIRWQHPERGLLPPAAFLNDLIDGDLEIAIGNWVIGEAMRQWCVWQHAGQGPETVGVNVSSHQLLKPGFVDTLATLLAQHPGFDPRALQLEILESTAISEIDQAAQVMRECQDLGVGFALDDFGTGYSSLSYFRRLPVDTLKVDQSFVRGMLSSQDDRGIVAAVVHLAQAFNRQVVAEGVETPALGDALLDLGCDIAQGYAIARPMPAADVPSWRRAWQAQHTLASPQA